ncbi:DHHC palmitoyltransferase-domain-containing protein [Mycena maculata]|uniref:Palmitoyltransferase n=1 Tax=Mycena maculata TaxID=230809 RepID=A0AAD7N5J6_9AGAR|nr:DHHC palmitoyltransferase-domain-containing protein [Mycena maculata]
MSLRSRGRRRTRLMELFIQLFVFLIIVYSLYITSIQIGIKWLIFYHGYRILGGIYVAAVLFLLPLLGIVYIWLSLGRNTHSTPRYPLPDKDDLTEPYECVNPDGDLATCSKCNGAWKPPRSHHCSTCGVCRIEFDHHCPWVGNCVTRSRMKAFLFMLFLAPVAYVVSVFPIYRTLTRHMSLALTVSQHDAWAKRVWWDWFGSWIFAGGPFGRWIFGMALGFRILKAQRNPDAPIIEQPTLRLFVICALGSIFSLFTLTLALWTLKDLVRGLTTLDVMQGRRQKHPSRFVCIPGDTPRVRDFPEASRRNVVPVIDGERLYDLGFWSNLRDVFDSRPYHGTNTALYGWPKINPVVLDRMRKMTQSQNISIDNTNN